MPATELLVVGDVVEFCDGGPVKLRGAGVAVGITLTGGAVWLPVMASVLRTAGSEEFEVRSVGWRWRDKVEIPTTGRFACRIWERINRRFS